MDADCQTGSATSEDVNQDSGVTCVHHRVRLIVLVTNVDKTTDCVSLAVGLTIGETRVDHVAYTVLTNVYIVTVFVMREVVGSISGKRSVHQSVQTSIRTAQMDVDKLTGSVTLAQPGSGDRQRVLVPVLVTVLRVVRWMTGLHVTRVHFEYGEAHATRLATTVTTVVSVIPACVTKADVLLDGMEMTVKPDVPVGFPTGVTRQPACVTYVWPVSGVIPVHQAVLTAPMAVSVTMGGAIVMVVLLIPRNGGGCVRHRVTAVRVCVGRMTACVSAAVSMDGTATCVTRCVAQ
jgi:hypothetical protein